MSLQDCSYGDVVHQFEKRCKKSLVAKKKQLNNMVVTEEVLCYEHEEN